MRMGLLFGVVALPLLFMPAFLAGDDKKDDAGKEELKKFEGTWKLKSLELSADEKGPPADEIAKMRLVFKGDKVTMKVGPDGEREMAFKIDPSKKPAHIDIQPAKGEEKPMIGIYKFEKEMLIICGSDAGDRPVDFTTKEGKKVGMMTLEKVKDEKTKD
jgi:uncharacterized protein (TIGR03067 family)